MKQKKTKAQKRIEKVRRNIWREKNPEIFSEHFCQLVGRIWSTVCEMIGETEAEDNIELLQDLVCNCECGWNIATTHSDFKEAEKFIDTEMAKYFPNEERPLLEMIRLAAALKYQYFPNDRVTITDSEVSLDDVGEVKIEVKFDFDDLDSQDLKLGQIPLMDEILDNSAIEKAVEGVPEDKVIEVIDKEIRRQIEEYNNTPQEILGGISPAEAYRRNHPEGMSGME